MFDVIAAVALVSLQAIAFGHIVGLLLVIWRTGDWLTRTEARKLLTQPRKTKPATVIDIAKKTA